MRRGATAALLVLSLALAACGGGDDEGAGTAADAPAQPSGALTAQGVGAVSVGTPSSTAAAEFGPADERAAVPGCELAANPPPRRVWTYELDGGELQLTFDEHGELLSYRTTSPALETAKGEAVSDPFAELASGRGGELEPLLLGSERPSKRRGAWYVPDGEEMLLFQMQGGTIASISGGRIEICE